MKAHRNTRVGIVALGMSLMVTGAAQAAPPVGGPPGQAPTEVTGSVAVTNFPASQDVTVSNEVDVNIVNSRTTYQFDKHFLVRLLEQFDSASRRLLTDLLASYELVPGTVFHAGYGSLYEQRALTPEAVGPNGFGDRYVTVNRGLFFKASYLHRF